MMISVEDEGNVSKRRIIKV